MGISRQISFMMSDGVSPGYVLQNLPGYKALSKHHKPRE
jgi:hypothetical protein